MKSLFIIIILILSVSPCFAQQDLLPAYPNEITPYPYTGGIAYFNGSPFTGILVDQKTMKQLGEFKNGYKNGLFTEYYTDEKKKNEGKYSMGIKEGTHNEWFENGNKKSEINFVNGKWNGMYTEWYENGNKKNEVKYINGLKDGIHTQWFENGNKKKEVNYSNGEWNGMSAEWFLNGQKKYEEKYINGKPDGIQVDWNEKGQKTKETTYKDGIIIREDVYSNGILESTSELKTEYFSGGAKKAEGLLKNGNKEGLWKRWYESGKKQSQGIYLKGIRDSIWTTWSENGEKDSVITYLYGKKKSETIYTNNELNWKIIDSLTDGKELVITWENNVKVSQGVLVNNKQDGKWTYWFDNGQKITEKTFLNGELIDEETKAIANLVSNFHQTNNSFLFKTLEKDKEIVRFDFKYQSNDDNIGKVIKVISGNLASSTRLVQIFSDGPNKDESINYVMECSFIDIKYETMNCKDSKGVNHTAYIATISATFNLSDMDGKYIDSQTYTSTNKGLLLTTCLYSPQAAFDAAYNKADYIKKFIYKNLPVKTNITAIEDKDSDGAAKTVTITGGTNIGIYSCEFAVFDEQNKSIGEIKTKTINLDNTTCKVKTGGDAISAKINAGVKLKVVSIE